MATRLAVWSAGEKIILPRLKAVKGFDVYSSESRRLCHGKTISTTAEMLDLETGERSILTDPVDESRAELSYWALGTYENYFVFEWDELCALLSLSLLLVWHNLTGALADT